MTITIDSNLLCGLNHVLLDCVHVSKCILLGGGSLGEEKKISLYVAEVVELELEANVFA